MRVLCYVLCVALREGKRRKHLRVMVEGVCGTERGRWFGAAGNGRWKEGMRVSLSYSFLRVMWGRGRVFFGNDLNATVLLPLTSHEL